MARASINLGVVPASTRLTALFTEASALAYVSTPQLAAYVDYRTPLLLRIADNVAAADSAAANRFISLQAADSAAATDAVTVTPTYARAPADSAAATDAATLAATYARAPADSAAATDAAALAATYARAPADSATATDAATPVRSDPSFANVTVLLHADNLTDVKGHTFTTSGAAAANTTQPKYGSGSFSLPGAAADYITSVASSDWTFGTAAFCVEAWVYPTAIGSSLEHQILSNIAATGNTASWRLFITQSGTVTLANWAAALAAGATVLTANVWTHVAATFDGTTYRVFVNGVLDGSGTTVANLSQVNPLMIGQSGVSGQPLNFQGYVDEVRITKGAARYTANFTTPNGPYPDQ